MELIEKVGGVIALKGKQAGDKARELAEVARLKSQISTCSEVMQKNYEEIGRLYYRQYGENPGDLFEKQCRAIKNAGKGVEELKEKIRRIKEE